MTGARPRGATPGSPDGAARRRLAGAIALSAAAHAGVTALLAWASTSPEVGFDFEIPDEVEFGLTSAEDLSEARAEAPPEPAAPPDPAGPTAPGPRAASAAADAGTPDAPTPDARADAAEDTGPSDAPTPDAPPDAALGSADAGPTAADAPGPGPLRLPPGAQLAIRLDMARIRASPLSADARTLLAAIPDWQLVLEGSGIDPIADLDRILIASPNLQRAEVRIAGEVHGDPATIRAATARMAAARGAPARWRRAHGVEIAPWANADATPRVVAIVGPRRFVLAQPDHLAAFLEVARARAAREGAADAGTSEDPLLALPEGAAMLFEVEGARLYSRAVSRAPLERIPLRAQAWITPREDGAIVVRARGEYADAAEARAAREFWEEQRRRAAGHPLVMLVGLSSALAEAEVTEDGSALALSTVVTVAQLRFVLQSLGAAPAAARAGGTPTTGPPDAGARLPRGAPAPL